MSTQRRNTCLTQRRNDRNENLTRLAQRRYDRNENLNLASRNAATTATNK